MVVLLLFGILFVGIFVGVPIAVAIGLAAFITFIYTGIDLTAFAQQMYSSIDSFTLLAIPFFMLAGVLMEEGGMSRRIVRFANSLFGTLVGGLAQVQVVASCFFAALSGSSPATTAAIGSALIPEMKKKGYPSDYAAAVQSVAGTIGTIIPPSIPMIIYGVAAGVSIGKLFAAGFIPGLLYGLSLMVVVYFTSKKRNLVSATHFSAHECWESFKDAIWALLVPIIILGGIYLGIFTPTEAGAVAAVYGLFASWFIYKEINIHNIKHILAKAAINTAMCLFIIAASTTFSWLMSIQGIARIIGQWFALVSSGRIVFLLLTVGLLLLMGCFMETIASLLIVCPILLPVAKSLGIDPVHFGIVIVMTLSLGMATPPVGENLYIAASIADVSFEKLIKNAFPFIIAAIVAILIVTFVPGISLVLPKLFY